jgi:hypothetical protein
MVLQRKKKTMAMCHRFLLWWCSNEEGDKSLLPSPFSLVVFKQRRKQQLVVVALFFVLKKKKMTTIRRHFFLWCYCNKEGNRNLKTTIKENDAPSFSSSSVVVLKQRMQ